MSFFSKVKQFLGIGTLSVKVQMPGHFSSNTIRLTAEGEDAPVLGFTTAGI